MVLYELAQVLRTRGWFNILRAAYPDAGSLRARDVACAYLAGAGLNAVLPARSGDVLKLFMVHRKLPSSRYSTLAATFLPETLFESLCGAALVIWALAHGFLPVPLGPGDRPRWTFRSSSSTRSSRPWQRLPPGSARYFWCAGFILGRATCSRVSAAASRSSGRRAALCWAW